MPQRLTHVQNPPDNGIRIGVEALAWNDRSGYGRYCRELVFAATEVSSRYAMTLVAPDDCAIPGIATVRLAGARSVGNPPRTMRAMLRLRRTMASMPVDMWFFPSPLNFVPMVSRVPFVIAIHDTIPWRFPELIFDNHAQRIAWRLKLRAAMRRATRIVTVSNHARESIAQRFGLDRERISIVGEAPAPVFRVCKSAAETSPLLERLGLPLDARLVVYHGAFSPHKNLPMLVDAYARLACEAEFSDVLLVMVGAPPTSRREEFENLQRMCRRLARVCFTGALEDAELARLLNRATVAVLPSLDEGFGLTGLEAAACGAALIATQNSALPEVLGEGAIYFDPRAGDALRADLARLLSSSEHRAKLRAIALPRIAALSWKKAAAQLIEIFDEIVAAGHVRRASM